MIERNNQSRLPIWLIKDEGPKGIAPRTLYYYSRGERFYIEDWIDLVKIRYDDVEVWMPDIGTALETVIEGLEMRERMLGY